MEPLILIVEDEPPLVEVIKYNFESAGFRTTVASDGNEALFQAEELLPELIILDWMLPGRSGIEVCRELRKRKNTKATPIIMLTARSEEIDKVKGLENGADDYVVKPFSPKELIARSKALLRRTKPGFVENKLYYADLEMDLEARRVFRNGNAIHLGPTEYHENSGLISRAYSATARHRFLFQT